MYKKPDIKELAYRLSHLSRALLNAYEWLIKEDFMIFRDIVYRDVMREIELVEKIINATLPNTRSGVETTISLVREGKIDTAKEVFKMTVVSAFYEPFTKIPLT